MPVLKRQQIAQITSDIAQNGPAPVYLIFGERFLCRSIANDLIAALLPDPATRDAHLVLIDGDQEDPMATLNQVRTFNLFGGRRIFRVNDTRLLLSKKVVNSIWDKAVKAVGSDKPALASRYIGQMLCQLPDQRPTPEALAALPATKWQQLFGFTKPQDLDWLAKIPVPQINQADAGNDPAAQYCAALTKGLPAEHVLILLAETVDKRKKLYTCLKKIGIIIDASVDAGLSTAARKQQDSVLRELIHTTLAQFGKTMKAPVQQELLNRVGFHPVAVVMEVEKLALYTGENPEITLRDLDILIGRTREDALFELNEAVSRRDLARTLILAARIQAGGMHPLAIIAGLRNHIRKLLRVRTMQQLSTPCYTTGMSSQTFQNDYLPQLRAHKQLSGLPTHPYALYKTFQQAGTFTISNLVAMLDHLLQAEFRLKSSGLPADVLLDNLIFAFFQQQLAA